MIPPGIGEGIEGAMPALEKAQLPKWKPWPKRCRPLFPLKPAELKLKNCIAELQS